jgi:hypothetical protein
MLSRYLLISLLSFVNSVIIKGSILLPQTSQAHEYPQTILIDGLSEYFVAYTDSAIRFAIDLPAGMSSSYF